MRFHVALLFFCLFVCFSLRNIAFFFFNLGYIDFPWNLSQNVFTCSPSHYFCVYFSLVIPIPIAHFASCIPLCCVSWSYSQNMQPESTEVMLLPDPSFHLKKCWSLVHQPNYSLCTLRVFLLALQHGAHSIPQLPPCLQDLLLEDILLVFHFVFMYSCIFLMQYFP